MVKLAYGSGEQLTYNYGGNDNYGRGGHLVIPGAELFVYGLNLFMGDACPLEQSRGILFLLTGQKRNKDGVRAGARTSVLSINGSHAFYQHFAFRLD